MHDTTLLGQVTDLRISVADLASLALGLAEEVLAVVAPIRLEALAVVISSNRYLRVCM